MAVTCGGRRDKRLIQGAAADSMLDGGAQGSTSRGRPQGEITRSRSAARATRARSRRGRAPSSEGTQAVPEGADRCGSLPSSAATPSPGICGHFGADSGITSTLGTAMVRKGSPVRVRQRALDECPASRRFVSIWRLALGRLVGRLGRVWKRSGNFGPPGGSVALAVSGGRELLVDLWSAGLGLPH
jgi:hypothetical protein